MAPSRDEVLTSIRIELGRTGERLEATNGKLVDVTLLLGKCMTDMNAAWKDQRERDEKQDKAIAELDTRVQVFEAVWKVATNPYVVGTAAAGVAGLAYWKGLV